MSLTVSKEALIRTNLLFSRLAKLKKIGTIIIGTIKVPLDSERLNCDLEFNKSRHFAHGDVYLSLPRQYFVPVP